MSIVFNNFQLCQIISNPVQSFQIVSIISNHFQSFPIISNRFQSFPIVSNHFQSFPIISNNFQSCPIISNHFKSSQIVSDHLKFRIMPGVRNTVALSAATVEADDNIKDIRPKHRNCYLVTFIIIKVFGPDFNLNYLKYINCIRFFICLSIQYDSKHFI